MSRHNQVSKPSINSQSVRVLSMERRAATMMLYITLAIFGWGWRYLASSTSSNGLSPSYFPSPASRNRKKQRTGATSSAAHSSPPPVQVPLTQRPSPPPKKVRLIAGTPPTRLAVCISGHLRTESMSSASFETVRAFLSVHGSASAVLSTWDVFGFHFPESKQTSCYDNWPLSASWHCPVFIRQCEILPFQEHQVYM